MTQTSPPAISVIVPVYNVANHVAACLDSLRGQLWTDFEVIVVDDGSTDGSAEQAERTIAGDPRFRLIRQENKGLSGARNTGLDAARGAFIAFVDSDDRVTRDYLSRLYHVLEETGGDWVACAVRFCHGDGTSHVHSAIHDAPRLGPHTATRRYPLADWTDIIAHFPSAWNKLYRRELIEGLRFDEGTWFEDHSFFQRAAARTDHILHVPDPLYLQTRDRPGQLTGEDDDRVFEQFDVLRRMQAIMQDGPHGKAEDACARIASRLLFERSVALREPERRTRFAQAAQRFLDAQKLRYSPEWDPDIALSWGLEMAGTLPLSVIMVWDGKDPDALDTTLDSLSRVHGPGHEVLVVGQGPDATARIQVRAARFPTLRALAAPRRAMGASYEHGLTEAQGRYVIFLRPGATPHPVALHDWTEAMLRHDADMGLSQFALRPSDPDAALIPHNGFADMRSLNGKTPTSGELTTTPAIALSMAPELSARIFRRAFLQEQGLKFTHGARPGGALGLGAALQAKRMVYTAWSGVTLPEAAGDSGPLARGHDAMIQALPETAKAGLPGGWQRRLFDRALREELRFGRSQKGIARHLMLATAISSAALRGLSGPSPRPAGFDTAFGPRSALLLDPVGLVRQLMGRPRAHSLATRQAALDNTVQKLIDVTGNFSMFAFPLQERGIFRFRADFSDDPFANLSFMAGDKITIPFHLSLRLNEDLVVCNHRDSDGNWGKERRKTMSLSPAGANVLIELAPPNVSVSLDGEEIFRYGRPGLLSRQGFAGMETIKYLDIQGGVRPYDLAPQSSSANLILDSRLQLRVSGDSAHHLTCVHSKEDLPLISASRESGEDLRQALFPGRLWQGLVADASLKLQPCDAKGDAAGTALTLSRADMASRLNELLSLGLTNADGEVALLAIEHARYGNLLPLLEDSARTVLLELARFYNLEMFLTGVEEDDEAPFNDQAEGDVAALMQPSNPDAERLDAAVARFARSLHQTPAPDPLDVVSELTLPKPLRQQLFVMLSEFFSCDGQDFEAFFAQAEKEGLTPFELTGNMWHDSAILPFLFLQNWTADMRKQMWAMSSPCDEWIVTPAVAWVVRRLLISTTMHEEDREDMLYAFMNMVTQRTPDYWERAHCREMTLAAASLYVQRHRTADYMQRDITRFCLRNYGLSRQFWDFLEGLHPKDRPHAPEIEAGLARFRVLDQSDQTAIDAEEANRALTFFDKYEAPDAARLRREVLGPGGVPLADGATLEVAPLIQTHWAPAASALRHMASPGAAPVTAQVSEMVARYIPELYPDLARAPYTSLQSETSRKVAAILNQPQRRIEGAEFDVLMEHCDQLAGSRSEFIGFALWIALITGLGQVKAQTDTLEKICTWLFERHEKLDGPRREKLARAACVRMALVTLRSRGTAPKLCQKLESRLLAGAPALPELPTTATDTGLEGGQQASTLFDTIVTVFSCKPFLDTRVPALRAGWLSLLEALGIPYVIVVGDGDGTRRSDVVHLDAPDDYEGLPQKTLATIRWVHDHTPYTHMIKIDDDCFVNAPSFFHALSYRKFDYYGRKLTRGIGQMDRAWHLAKSSSVRGRMELDKSPEPSTYADGGSGYALSRTAMKAALKAAQSPEGQKLIQTSFMEDKLLGDLLTTQGIHVSEEDYRVSIRRRTYSKATPVAFWHNSFYPSLSAPVQQVHMDTHLGQPEAVARLEQHGLWPRKVWPSYQDARLGYQSNALEMISDESRIKDAREAEVALVACMRNEMFMLPHFLAHYRKLGVTSFLIADNGSDDGTLEFLAEQPDVALFSVDTDYNLSRYGVAWQQALMSAFRVGKWSIVADADELLLWQEKQTQTLPDLLSDPGFDDADAVRIFMLDMYPKGPLEKATFKTDPFREAGFCDAEPFLTHWHGQGPYSNQRTWTSALRHRLIPGSRPDLFVAQKLALLKYQPWMRLSAGLHFVGDVRVAERELLFAHFKYNSDFRRKARTEVARRQHFNDAEEYRKYLALASEGRSVIHDPTLSVPWTQSAFVRARLGDQPR